MAFAQDLGYPATWGDSSLLPPYGGKAANQQWATLGVSGRDSVGGLPCEIVHGGVGAFFGCGGSCLMNAIIRGSKGFLQAMLIYIPVSTDDRLSQRLDTKHTFNLQQVHFLPVILSRPWTLKPHLFITLVVSCLRSSTFLASFISSVWYTVCLTRTLVFARLFPSISHNFWDGPYGCILAGCLTCGGSIWIEESRRRGEMALYVLPRALRTTLSTMTIRMNRHVGKFIEA